MFTGTFLLTTCMVSCCTNLFFKIYCMTAADFGEQTHEDGSLPASHDRGGDEPWQWKLCSTVSAPHCRALQKYYRTAVERWAAIQRGPTSMPKSGH